MKFQTRFDFHQVELDFTGVESLAKQEFKDEADINVILKRYEQTGSLIDPSVRPARVPMFLDTTTLPGDTQEAYQMFLEAQEKFEELPVDLRRYFDFDPAKLLDFVGKKENKLKAIELGLIAKPVEEPKTAAELKTAAEPKTAVDPTEYKAHEQL